MCGGFEIEWGTVFGIRICRWSSICSLNECCKLHIVISLQRNCSREPSNDQSYRNLPIMHFNQEKSLNPAKKKSHSHALERS